MLGDSSEKSKNPLKKAMRRRNTKTVAFSAPTYIEASDNEFSSDDESDDGGFFIDDQEPLEAEAEDTQEGRDEDMVVEPLRPKAQKEKDIEEPEVAQDGQEGERHTPEMRQSNEEYMESEGKTTLPIFPFHTANGLLTACRWYYQPVEKWHCTEYGFVL